MVFGLAVGYIGTRFIKISSGSMMSQQRDDVAHIVVAVDAIQRRQAQLEMEVVKANQGLEVIMKRQSLTLDGLEELLRQKDTDTATANNTKFPTNMAPANHQHGAAKK